MPSVAEFVSNEAETTLRLGKDQLPVVIRYRPSEITTGRIEQMAERDRAGDLLAFVRMLCEVVIEWDLEGPLFGQIAAKREDGKPERDADDNIVYRREQVVGEGQVIQIEPDVLRHMSQPLLGAIWRGLVEEQSSPDPQTSRGLRRR